MTLFLIPVLMLGALSAQDGVRYPGKPGPREFVLDEAKILKPEDAAEIRILCDEVLSQKKAPIMVVTIPSLATYGAAGWPIERYALNLMSEWGVGWPEWNYGMLLLVSLGDRKARIELGSSWERRKDDAAKRLMTEQIMPLFKEAKPSKGILEGVRGLKSIALGAVPAPGPERGASPLPGDASGPTHPQSGARTLPLGGCGKIPLMAGGLLLVFFVFRMLRRRNLSSWGNQGPYGGGNSAPRGGGFGSSLGGGIIGGALGSMIGNALGHLRGSSGSSPQPAGDSGGGGSFGGSSFGGGFSGGGGATGEW